MRVVILWSTLTGYMASCFKAFSEIYAAQLLIVAQPADPNAPYSEEEFSWINNLVIYKDGSDYPALKRNVLKFQPDAIFMCSWNFRDYMKLAKTYPLNKLPRVSGTDNQWHGTMKQCLGAVISPFYLKPSIDCFFVPGERQVAFCHKLGYDYNRIVTGFYTCDIPRYASVYEQSINISIPKAFLFAGRMVPEKGILDLIEAYKSYRKQCSDPYPLICVGKGPLSDMLRRIEGIEVVDFVQPRMLPAIFGRAGCFVLPSTFEPWGVVVHEATTAGLAVITTRACGAAVHLVRDGYNGIIVRSKQPDELAAAMIEYTSKPDAEKKIMSQRSNILSRQFSTELWAYALHKGFQKAVILKRRH